MKRWAMAALAAFGAVGAGSAGAQTFFNFTGTLTSMNFDLNYGLTPISAPYNAVASFAPSYASDYYRSPVLIGGVATGADGGVGYGSVTEVSDLEYLVSVSAVTGDTPAYLQADLKLAAPLPVTPGALEVLPTSTIELTTRFHEYYGSITNATTAVPEASAWAMMMAGLGVTGGALRRRPARQRAAVTN